jgi:hypothetical protein
MLAVEDFSLGAWLSSTLMLVSLLHLLHRRRAGHYVFLLSRRLVRIAVSTVLPFGFLGYLLAGRFLHPGLWGLMWLNLILLHGVLAHRRRPVT